MLRFFRRRRPAPAPFRLPVSEALAASAHGFTEAGWLNLTDQKRAHYRATITTADRFKGGN